LVVAKLGRLARNVAVRIVTLRSQVAVDFPQANRLHESRSGCCQAGGRPTKAGGARARTRSLTKAGKLSATDDKVSPAVFQSNGLVFIDIVLGMSLMI
jgi:hypothetical protein